jgi:cyclase
MNIRIIPRLDIKGPNLVKGIHFEGLRVLGKPEWFARYYYENGADELYYQDAVASLYGRNSLLDIIEKTSKEIFIPLCIGGGLRSVDDIRKVLRAGADKVVINSAAIRNPELIKKASRTFGSSTILISVEAIKKNDGTYEAYIDYGREETGIDAVEWSKKAVDLGAGEIIVTSINHEGTGKGFDLELTELISKAVPVPVIAGGGAGNLGHVIEVVAEGMADAVSLSSLLHYNFIQHDIGNIEQFSDEGNIEFLRNRGSIQSFPKIEPATIREVKKHLISNSIATRYT